MYGAMVYLGSDGDQGGFQVMAIAPSPTSSPIPMDDPTGTPVQTVTPSPIPTNPNTSTPTVAPAPTPTFTPRPEPTPPPMLESPTEREMVVSAFAECNGQYAGEEIQRRIVATNSTIDRGFHSVASVRALVEQECDGVFPALAANVEQIDRTPEVGPTHSPTLTPVPTRTPIPTRIPTPVPTLTMLEGTGGDGRFSQATLEKMIFELINAYRVEQGLPALENDPRLAQIARAHSKDMADNDHYSHVNLLGEDPSARARRANYDCRNPLSIGIAENIILGYGHRSSTRWGSTVTYDWYSQDELAELFANSWINSLGHRRNILDPRYGLTGMGIAFGTSQGIRHGVYGTQNFC